MTRLVTFEKVGLFHNTPDWRYQFFCDPKKSNLTQFCRKPAAGSSSLVRYIRSLGLDYTVHKSLTPDMQRVLDPISGKNRDMFFKLFNKRLKAQGFKNIFCQTYEAPFKQWKLKDIDKLNDEFFRRLVYFASGFKYDPYIDFAIRLRTSEQHSEILRYMGFSFYAKVSDEQIAKRWRLKIKQVEAIRLLFFDFSNAPKDRIASLSYFRQLVVNRLYTEEDFRFFKKINELGELGLKAHLDFHSLTEEERRKVEDYLGASMWENTLNINFSVTNMRDALSYNGVINNLANFYIKKEEVKYYQAKTRNLDVSTRSIEGALAGNDITHEADVEALEIIKNLSRHDNVLPEYRSITDLK